MVAEPVWLNGYHEEGVISFRVPSLPPQPLPPKLHCTEISFVISVREKKENLHQNHVPWEELKILPDTLSCGRDIGRASESKIGLRGEKITAVFIRRSALVLKRHVAGAAYISAIATSNSRGLQLGLPK